MGRKRASSSEHGAAPRSPARHTMGVTIDVVTVPLPDDGLSSIPCPHCKAPLTIHQPEAHVPDHLLGTCEGCGAWYVVGLVHDGHEAVFVHLAVDELVRRAAEAG